MTILNGNYIWRLVLIAVIGGMVSIGGWVFSQVRDIPVTYETKEKHEKDIVYQRETHDKDITKLKEIMEKNTARIEKKVDETNNFLRNHFAHTSPNPNR